MRTFGAMMLDAYRQLNSKKLFWITLALSGIVVVYYGSIGFTETGVSMFYGLVDIENEVLTAGSPMSALLYRSIFSSLIVTFWLAWIATILALISTTTVFPDFMASGAIDLVLAKPIGRVRLFFLKYTASLLFVLLQVGIFCVGVFLCMGIRIDDWEWKIFAAIPLIVVFYSYLYAVNVFLGTWTRSALTALLVTMLFWFSLYGVNQAEGIINLFRTQWVIDVEERDRSIERLESSLALSAGADSPNRPQLEQQVQSLRDDRDEVQERIDTLERWHRPIRAIQVVLPKTAETIGLLDRWLKRDTDINVMDIFQGNVVRNGEGGFTVGNETRDREVLRRMEAEYGARSEWYVIGTSLVFEAVVLAGACLIFVRRDF